MTQGSWIFGLVLIYPLISIIALRLMGQPGGGLFSQLKNEYYLWVWTSIAYVGIISILFFGTKIIMPATIALIAYTIFYFLISVVRKFVWTDSKDIFAKTTP